MKKVYIIVFLMLSFGLSFAQTYNMQNGSVNTCTGNFYDSGGVGGNYGNSENFTFTICPDTAGTFTQVDFTLFNLEGCCDDLLIYNGPNTGSPLMGNAAVGTFTSSDASGCLTFVFTSDLSINRPGWEADISCFVPCTDTITANLDSTNPAASGNGVIEICQGTTVDFVGSGTFSGSSAGAVYDWDFGDGNTASGTNVSHTYNTEGVYIVNLTITNGSCVSTNRINQVVQVSPTPDFTGTAAAADPICLGDSTTITGVVTPQSISANCAPPVVGTTFLPDSSTGVYQTCITVDCYPAAQTMTSVNDLLDVFMNIEHSYLGDINISLTAPNGTTISLHDACCAATKLGTPDENDGTGPGVGWDYSFVEAGSTGVAFDAAPTMANGNGDQAKTPGAYDSDNSFAAFIGTPLNGDWCLTINDNLAADDGYIFNWGVNFDPSIPPQDPNYSHNQTIVSDTWTANQPTGNITGTVGSTITVQPTATGTHCYTFTVVDDFGCSYDEVVCIDVNPSDADAGTNGTVTLCDNSAAIDLITQLGGTPQPGGTWTGPSALTNGDQGTFTPGTNVAGTYTYSVVGATCGSANATVTVTINPAPDAGTNGAITLIE